MSEGGVAKWYDENVELEDFRLDAGRLEFAVTLHQIQDIIAEIQEKTSRRSLNIADIGCGTGRYAIELAKQGHTVSISDISSREVDFAVKKAAQLGVEFATSEAFDARNLRKYRSIYREGDYDILLLLGPFYHILEERERRDLLSTALHTVHPDGYLIAAFVTRNAHLRDIAVRDPHRLSSEADFYKQYLQDGKYTGGTAAPMHHTTINEIYQLLVSVRQDGHFGALQFELKRIIACEGFLGFQHASHLSRLDDDTFQRWLDVILASATERDSLGAADHLLVILKRTK